MRKAAVALMAIALALALAVAAAGAGAEAEAVGVRRSRFLASKKSPPPLPLSYYNCRRKPPSVCLERGSPGATCCKGHCVDTRSSIAHCGRCHHVCKHGKTCCGGRCVDLRKDRKNCGDCFVHCPKKCSFGMCDYAG